MMLFFTLLDKLMGAAKKVGIPLAALGLSLFLSIGGTYSLALVWGGMLVLRMLLGKFSRMDLRYTVILTFLWVGWNVYDAYHGPLGKFAVLRMLPEIAVVLGMIVATFVSEQYVGGELAAWIRAKWLKWTTGKAHRESNSDIKGSGRLREADDMVPGKLGEFAIDDPGKPHVVLGSLVSERDHGKALKMLPTAKFLRWEPQGHMADFAGSRGGKSSGPIAAALVHSWTGSAFVKDIKPELRDWSRRVTGEATMGDGSSHFHSSDRRHVHRLWEDLGGTIARIRRTGELWFAHRRHPCNKLRRDPQCTNTKPNSTCGDCRF